MKRTLQNAVLAFAILLIGNGQSTLLAQPYPPQNYPPAQPPSGNYPQQPYENDGYDDDYNNNTDNRITYQQFYDNLSPYGQWINHSQLGYVWVPNSGIVGNDFRPYSSAGHWVYTDNYEWMWVSDYDWGWAPFHYGRWDYDPYYKWFWVPGYDWSPAWVAWRDGGDYYGWAPLRPGISVGINFNIGSYAPPVDFWCFAPRRYVLYPSIYRYCVAPRLNISIISHTSIISNYRYQRRAFCTGPLRANVEIYAGRISPVRFGHSARPGRTVIVNNQINVYRPGVSRGYGRSYRPQNTRLVGGNSGRPDFNRTNYPRQYGNRNRQNNTESPRRNDRSRSNNDFFSGKANRQPLTQRGNTEAPVRNETRQPNISQPRNTRERQWSAPDNVVRGNKSERSVDRKIEQLGSEPRPNVRRENPERNRSFAPNSEHRQVQRRSESGSSNEAVGNRAERRTESGGRADNNATKRRF